MIKFRNALHNQKGFTLIELLVVVIIIGILAAVALPNLLGASDKAKFGAVESDLKVIATAVETFYADNGTYPEDQGDLVEVNLLRAVLEDPWGQEYEIEVVEGVYIISSTKEGTATVENGILKRAE